MAPDGVEDAEYESDPEELKRSLATRRREASDDDEDEGVKELNFEKRGGNQSPEIESDENSGLDNDGEEGLHVEGEDGGDSYDEEEEEDYGEADEHMDYAADNNDKASKPMGNGDDAAEDPTTDLVDGEEEKQKAPFAVPTAGAFYMHDDRFQEIDGGTNRRMRGGKRLWQSRDERKWGHDKYEEMNTQEKQNDRRTSRGRVRGRGQGRGQERGYSRGSNGQQNQFPKAATRGRGSKMYEVALRNGNQAPSLQSKQSWYSFAKVAHVDSGCAPTETASTETETTRTRKNIVASSLNSASPPFYPSGSSNNLAQNDLQAGLGKLHINETRTQSGKKVGNVKSSLSWVRIAQPSQTTSQGRGAPTPGNVVKQNDKVSLPRQIRGMPIGTDQSCIQPPAQSFDQYSTVSSVLPSSPPKNGSAKNQYLSGEIESATETGALAAKGKGTLQPCGRGSFMYGGTHFMGPSGSMAPGHGNPNFPAFLPLMQFGGGQHGGVPTFGMALPGYVQPEHGTGNPEMTWLPILTGPGALGASYCPPYAAIDGSYQAQKPVLPSSAGSSSQENSLNNPNDEEKPVERPEITNDGASQRSNSNPNKQPRRYSEMSFGK